MISKELEKTLWAAAKKLQNNADTYAGMHMILGLIFLRCITDLVEQNENLVKGKNSPAAANAENQGEYLAYNEYFVPQKAQWKFLQSNALQPAIGELIDDAIQALEKLNENLREIFPKDYSNPSIDKSALGKLIGLTGNIDIGKNGNKKKDSLVQAFDYILEMFARTGKTEGQFYIPQDIARLLVEMAEPRQGKIYDGCCGTGSLFVESIKFIKKYRGNINNLAFYGQDDNAAVIKIAKMNLIIHGITAHLQPGNSITNDCFPNLQADFILGSPPFNQRDWKEDQSTNDNRWQYGVPPAQNANYAWLQHFISKLGSSATAGVVLANNSINPNTGAERKIRKNLIEARLVDCIVTLPSHVFYNTNIPVCLWILAKNRINDKYRNPGNEILFIDARKLSVKSIGGKRELTDEMILLISRTYHRWRNINGDYTDLKKFCKAVSIETVSKKGYSLKPPKYISDSKAKKIFAAVFFIIFFAVLYFIGFKNGLFTPKSPGQDTALTVQSKIVKDSLTSQKNERKTVKKQEKEKPVKAAGSVSNTIPDKPVNRTPTAEKDIPEETKVNNAAISYKVISKAYFYNEPDETTRRRAYITHWNNSYADIRGLDEKNGFIYVVFTNHLHQRSKGWLRKKDLKETNQ